MKHVWIIETRASTPPQWWEPTGYGHCSLKSDALDWMRELRDEAKRKNPKLAAGTQWRVAKYERKNPSAGRGR